MKNIILIALFSIGMILNAQAQTASKALNQDDNPVVNPYDCQGYKPLNTGWCGTYECNAKSGVCCLRAFEIKNGKVALIKELLNEEKGSKFREIIQSQGWSAVGLDNIVELKSAESIKNAIINNTIVLKIMFETKSEIHIALITTKSLRSKKHDYVGHVTLLK